MISLLQPHQPALVVSLGLGGRLLKPLQMRPPPDRQEPCAAADQRTYRSRSARREHLSVCPLLPVAVSWAPDSAPQSATKFVEPGRVTLRKARRSSTNNSALPPGRASTTQPSAIAAERRPVCRPVGTLHHQDVAALLGKRELHAARRQPALDPQRAQAHLGAQALLGGPGDGVPATVSRAIVSR